MVEKTLPCPIGKLSQSKKDVGLKQYFIFYKQDKMAVHSYKTEAQIGKEMRWLISEPQHMEIRIKTMFSEIILGLQFNYILHEFWAFL